MKNTNLQCQAIENSETLLQGISIVITNALNAPPHIGILFKNSYSSLSHKGQEINVRIDVLLKKMKILSSPCVFIEIKNHPVYSINYLQELFNSYLNQFKRAGTENTTCLSPIKLFFQEAYFINSISYNFIFELIPILKEQSLLIEAYSMFFNLKKNVEFHTYEFPIYTTEKIHDYIKIKTTS